jgi:hypothetical protein
MASEQLLEFEEALGGSHLNALLLQLLEGKLIDRLNCPVPLSAQYSQDDLDRALDAHEFGADEFLLCSKCGLQLNRVSQYRQCCASYVALKAHILSSLERAYWVNFINNPTGTINTLPNYTTMLMLQQGIPLQIRAVVWNRLLLIGDEIPATSQLIYDNFQHLYLQEIADQISKDLHRTFPNVAFFTLPQTVQDLSTILNVYANYDAELGYCQGLLFLVGVLYYHFRLPALTFHALCVVVQSEPELHDIFTALTMSHTLGLWLDEFTAILHEVDPELALHMDSQLAAVEKQVFLYQWWLLFASSHIPDMSLVNRIMDLCLTQGWKVGLFKVSLGLLLVNKPILMSLGPGDEEVVYQHLLNESKWGNAVNDIERFFGTTLMRWNDALFVAKENIAPVAPCAKPTHSRTPSYVMSKFKQLLVNLSRTRSNSDHSAAELPLSALTSTSSLSVFSQSLQQRPQRSEKWLNSGEVDSLYSDITSNSSDEIAEASGGNNAFGHYLKLPSHLRSHSKVDTIRELPMLEENKLLRELLGSALHMIEGEGRDETTVNDIRAILGLNE